MDWMIWIRSVYLNAVIWIHWNLVLVLLPITSVTHVLLWAAFGLRLFLFIIALLLHIGAHLLRICLSSTIAILSTSNTKKTPRVMPMRCWTTAQWPVTGLRYSWGTLYRGNNSQSIHFSDGMRDLGLGWAIEQRVFQSYWLYLWDSTTSTLQPSQLEPYLYRYANLLWTKLLRMCVKCLSWLFLWSPNCQLG